MASHLILDRTDPGVNELVSGWVDGQTYDVRLKILQTNTDPKTARYEVLEVADESGEAEPATEAEGTPPAKKAAPGKPSVTIQK